MKTQMLALFAAVAFSVRASSASIDFKVECDLGGRHGDDIDRIDPEREKQLLEAAIVDTYPHLPPELRDVARQITFRIAHYPEKLSKQFSGWSAEDDPDYRYPDRDFYPQGTIKANFTEKYIRALDLGVQLGQTNPGAANGIRGYWRQVIAHELRHAWQYHTNPVRDLELTKGSVKDGLADEEILNETKKKIQYERDAFATHRPIVREHKDGLIALANAIGAYAQANPELFGSNGEYRLLARGASPFTDRYLRDEVEQANQGDDFTPTSKIIYEGQYVPAEIVWALKRLNDRKNTPGSDASQVEELKRRWRQYMEGPSAETLKKTYPFIADIGRRFQIELERFQQAQNTR